MPGPYFIAESLANVTREPYSYAGGSALNAVDPTGLTYHGWRFDGGTSKSTRNSFKAFVEQRQIFEDVVLVR
jgi:hypothetical protein